MTVAQLIEELSKLPGHADAFLEYGAPVVGVVWEGNHAEIIPAAPPDDHDDLDWD